MQLRPPVFLSAVICLVTGSLLRPAAAGPLDEGHVGVPGFSGPTSGDLGAIYWNPAALGLMREKDVLVVGGFRQTSTTARRDPIDPTTGASPGSLGFGSTTSRVRQYPRAPWPPWRVDRFTTPGSMVAVGGAMHDRWSLALALYSPFSYHLRYAPTSSGQEPTRYHVVDADIQHVSLAPSLAIRVSSGFHIGATLGWMSSRGHMSWDEDSALERTAGVDPTCSGAPCGVENPEAAERYRLEGVRLFDDVVNSLALGMLLRRGRLDIGASYTKQMIGAAAVRFIPGRTIVNRAPRLGGQEQAATSEFYYKLPDMATLGVTWRASRVDWTGMARWMRYSMHQNTTLRIAGPDLRQELTLFRGYRDNLDVRARALVSIGQRWRLGGTLRAETTAVSASHVTAASVDGLKVEPMLAAEVRLGPFRLSAAYSLLLIPNVKVERSVFDPRAALECSAQGHDLSSAPCQVRGMGAARSTGTGRYRLLQHGLSLATTLFF